MAETTPGNIDEFDKALDSFGFQEVEKLQLYQLLTGIYCVTKIQFATTDDKCSVITNDAFYQAAKYLSIEEGKLLAALTTRAMQNMQVMYVFIIRTLFGFNLITL